MADHCYLSPTCEHGPHAPGEHPCGQRAEKPGDLCRFCAEPVPDPPPCLECWQPIDIPTFKALMAEHGFDTTTGEGGQ